MRRLKKVICVSLCSLFITQNICATEVNTKSNVKVTQKKVIENSVDVTTTDKNIKSSIIVKDDIQKLVKKKLGLKDDYTVEYCDLDIDEQFDKQVWDLELVKPGFNDYSVRIDAVTGELLRYSIWSPNSYQRLVKITEEEAKEVAIKYLKEKYPEKYKQVVDVVVANSTLAKQLEDYYDYNFMFVQEIDGEYFYDNFFRFEISGYDGSIRRFETNWSDATYKRAKGSASLKEAKKIFSDNDYIKLRYIKVNNDSKDGAQKVLKPVYVYENLTSGILDSKTKEFIDRNDIYKYNNIGYDDIATDNCKNESKDVAGNGGYYETIPEEGVISKEKAIKLAQDKVKKALSIDGLNVMSAKYNTWSKLGKGKYWDINWFNDDEDLKMDALVDAVTGDILSIIYSLKDTRDYPYAEILKQEYFNGVVSKTKYQQKMNLMLASGEITKEVYDNRFVATAKLTDATDYINNANTLIKKLMPDVNENEYEFKSSKEGRDVRISSRRYINGIPYDNNRIEVEYDIKSKEVQFVRYYWENDLTIEKPKKIMPVSEIEDIFYSEVGFEKRLIQLRDKTVKDDNKIKPLKELACICTLKPYRFSYIRPENGQLLNYAGEPYKKPDNQPTKVFSDISSNKYCDIINMMNKMNCIEETRGSFYPGSMITRIDALKWTVLTLRKNFSYLPLAVKYKDFDTEDIKIEDMNKEDPNYEYVIQAMRYGILDTDLKRFSPKRSATKMDMAKWLINGMGYKDLATYNKIFKKVYTDDVKEEEIGYLAIADYLNIFNANDEVFDVDSKVKRADYVKVLYDMIIKLRQK